MNMSIHQFSILAITLAMLTVSSCKKNDKACTLARVTVSDGTSFPGDNVFYYHPDGRVKKIVYNNAIKDTVFYSADSIFIVTSDYRDTLIGTYSGVLNSNGDVISAIQNNIGSGGSVSSEILIFEYNSDRQITKQTKTSGGINYVTNFTYVNGNRVSATEYSDTSLAATYFYKFLDTENKPGFATGTQVFYPYYGKGDKNLLSSFIKIENTDTSAFEFEHTLTSSKYLSKTRQTQIKPFTSSLYFVYSYTCEE
jgi:hypothetical protein